LRFTFREIGEPGEDGHRMNEVIMLISYFGRGTSTEG
jgi:hypothetical protein